MYVYDTYTRKIYISDIYIYPYSYPEDNTHAQIPRVFLYTHIYVYISRCSYIPIYIYIYIPER